MSGTWDARDGSARICRSHVCCRAAWPISTMPDTGSVSHNGRVDTVGSIALNIFISDGAARVAALRMVISALPMLGILVAQI